MPAALSYEQTVKHLAKWVGSVIVISRITLDAHGQHDTVRLPTFTLEQLPHDSENARLITPAGSLALHLGLRGFVHAHLVVNGLRISYKNLEIVISRLKDPPRKRANVRRDDPVVVEYHQDLLRDVASRLDETLQAGNRADRSLLEELLVERIKAADAADLPPTVIAKAAQVRLYVIQRALKG